MIGKNLTLLDTGAPTPEEIRRLERERLGPAPARRARAIRRGPQIPARLQTALLSLGARWQPAPVRLWRELAALGLFGLGLSWGIPWFRALTAATDAVPPTAAVGVFAAAGLAAYLLVRILAGFQVPAGTRQLVFLGFIPLAAAAGLRTILYTKQTIPLTELIMRPLWALGHFTELVPNEVVVAVAILLVIRRGAVLSRDHIGPERARSEFRNGFAMFLLYAALITIVTGESVPDWALLAYLFSGLAAMGGARMDAVAELRGGVRAGFDRRRLLSLSLGVTVSALLAYQVGLAFGRDGGALAALVLGAGVLAGFVVAVPLLLAVLYLLYFVVSLFQGEIARAVARLLAAVDSLLAFLDSLGDWIREAGAYLATRFEFLAPVFRALFALAPGLRFIVLAGVILLPIALALAVVAVNRRSRTRNALEEELSSLDWLGIRSILRLKTGERGGRSAWLGPGARRRWLAARVRRMYAQLLRLAAAIGVPKAPAETPGEFSENLRKRLPEAAESIDRMTRAYERVRYGELPERPADVRSVAEDWKQVQHSARRLQAPHRR